MRVSQKYFNDHYQLYNRKARMWLYYGHTGSRGGCPTDAARRADALAAFNTAHPVAAVNFGGASADAFSQAMAEKGVLDFTASGQVAAAAAVGRHQTVFSSHPGLIWSFLPSMEENEEMFASYVCSK